MTPDHHAHPLTRLSRGETPRHRRGLGAAICAITMLAGVALAAGCQPEPDIRQYTIDTRRPPELDVDQRMIGAIVPQGSESYFYKLVGRAPEVDQVANEVRLWISTVSYGDRPQWQVPEGWRVRWGGANAFDVATLELSVGEPPLELKVTKLHLAGDWDQYVAQNVNRWRGQMGLPPSEEPLAGAEPLTEASATETTDSEPPDTELTDSETTDSQSPTPVWVSLTGSFGDTSMTGGAMSGGGMAGGAMGGAMAGGAPPAASTTAENASPGSGADTTDGADATEPPVEYDTPEGWRPGRMSSMRLAAFEVGPEGKTAELTVIQARGDERANIERWLGEIRPDGVEPAVVDEVIAAAQEVTVSGHPSKRYLMTGTGSPPEATDATIIPLADGFSLFVKMRGDAETVTAETERIAQFLDSLKLNL